DERLETTMSSPDLLQQDRIGGCRTDGPPLDDEPHLDSAPLDPERNVSDDNGFLEIKRLTVRGHQCARREDHAQADWAELDAIDERCEGFPPRSIAPEIVANAIRHRQCGR